MVTRSKLIILIGLAVLAMVLNACTSPAGTDQPLGTEASPTELAITPEVSATDKPAVTPAAVSHGNEIGGYVDLVDALRSAGANVEPGGEVEQPFFSVKGQMISVNDADVQVFEYADESARKSDSDLISPDGTNVGTSMITWIDQPNFWAKGRIIILYVGKDPAVIELLNGILGEPITQHP